MRTKLAALGLLTALMDVKIVLACKCQPSSVAEGLGNASDVFSGRVVGRTKVAFDEGDEWDLRPSAYRYDFQVDRVWKGKPGASLAVFTGANSCGVSYQLGKSYLVLTYHVGTHLATDRCPSRAASISDVEAILGSPAIEYGQVRLPSRRWLWDVGAGLLLVSSLVCLILFAGRRRRVPP